MLMPQGARDLGWPVSDPVDLTHPFVPVDPFAVYIVLPDTNSAGIERKSEALVQSFEFAFRILLTGDVRLDADQPRRPAAGIPFDDAAAVDDPAPGSVLVPKPEFRLDPGGFAGHVAFAALDGPLAVIRVNEVYPEIRMVFQLRRIPRNTGPVDRTLNPPHTE
jgi:hypothetical protein